MQHGTTTLCASACMLQWMVCKPAVEACGRSPLKYSSIAVWLRSAAWCWFCMPALSMQFQVYHAILAYSDPILLCHFWRPKSAPYVYKDRGCCKQNLACIGIYIIPPTGKITWPLRNICLTMDNIFIGGGYEYIIHGQTAIPTILAQVSGMAGLVP